MSRVYNIYHIFISFISTSISIYLPTYISIYKSFPLSVYLSIKISSPSTSFFGDFAYLDSYFSSVCNPSAPLLYLLQGNKASFLPNHRYSLHKIYSRAPWKHRTNHQFILAFFGNCLKLNYEKGRPFEENYESPRKIYCSLKNKNYNCTFISKILVMHWLYTVLGYYIDEWDWIYLKHSRNL